MEPAEVVVLVMMAHYLVPVGIAVLCAARGGHSGQMPALF
jgi:hypothetical protein